MSMDPSLTYTENQSPSNLVLKPLGIPGTEHYRAGSDGFIYSNHAKLATKTHGEWGRLKHIEYETAGKYPCVFLRIDGKYKGRVVHRLICSAFHGHRPGAAFEVRHLDGVRSNNRPENLKWGTKKENAVDRIFHGRSRQGEAHCFSKVSNEDRIRLRWAYLRGLCTVNHAARMFGMTQRGMSAIMLGKGAIFKHPVKQVP